MRSCIKIWHNRVYKFFIFIFLIILKQSICLHGFCVISTLFGYYCIVLVTWRLVHLFSQTLLFLFSSPSIFKFSDKICTCVKFEVMDYFKLEWIVHRKQVVFSLVELEGAVVFEDNCVCVCLWKWRFMRLDDICWAKLKFKKRAGIKENLREKKSGWSDQHETRANILTFVKSVSLFVHPAWYSSWCFSSSLFLACCRSLGLVFIWSGLDIRVEAQVLRRPAITTIARSLRRQTLARPPTRQNHPRASLHPNPPLRDPQVLVPCQSHKGFHMNRFGPYPPFFSWSQFFG